MMFQMYSLKMLCSPVLASFADSKLLVLVARTSASMTLRINRTLSVVALFTSIKAIPI